ncbi:MAG: hypothetical protein H8M99_00405, partial [Gloeobacteraceae cyanobacterium ES-bin-144]|nr:hypothetical protein [Verrucomicrobiales bacterium]
MSTRRLPPQDEVAREHPLMIEDTRLARVYSVIEVALIAAGCAGNSADSRINDAIDLLSAAERHAFADKWEKHTKWAISVGQSGEIGREREWIEANKVRNDQADSICGKATRDQKTGKIIRTSLIGLSYQAAGIGRDEAQANRLYHEWLRQAMTGYAKAIPFSELVEILGPIPWNPQQINQWAEEVAKREASANVVSFKARFESGTKLSLIHDEHVAKNLVYDFLGWLENRPKKPASKITRSRKPATNGQAISRKTRGSDRAEGTEKGVSKAGNPRKRGQ